jgi:hypothetical protein
MTITVTASGISLDGPLVAGEVVAVSVSGVTFAEDSKPTLCLLGRFPDALLSSVELAEDENTPGTWTGELDTATKQTAVFFATARADECRDAVLELVAARQSVARLMVAFRNSALCPSPFHAPDASPVYVPVPGPPGQGGDPYDQNPAMDGVASAGVSDEYARGDHRHPTDESRMAATATGVDIKAGGDVGNISITAALTQLDEDLGGKQDTIADLAAIRSGAEAGATAVQPADLATVATTGAYGDLTGTPTIPSALPNPQPLHVGAADYDGSTEAWAPGAGTDGTYGIVTLESATNSTQTDGYAATPLAVKTVADAVSTKATATAIAPAFSASSTYAVGDYVTHEGLLYKCTTAVSTAGAWNAANWSAVAVTGEMGQSTPLPFDAEVEYIENFGCDFPLYAAGELDVAAEIFFTDGYAGNDFAIGAWKTANCFCIYMINGKVVARYNSTNATSVDKATGTWRTVGIHGSVFYYGDTTSAITRAAFGDASSRMSVGVPSGVRLRSIKFGIVGGAPVLDLVPVRVGTVGYLYEKITGSMFATVYQSDPTIGPDKAVPTITTPDKLVEIDERNNYLTIASTTTLDPATAVYRATATLSGTTATMPTVTITGIPTAAAYFAFEMEVAVDATATALDDTAWSGWTWMDGGELPTADYAGKTLYIACRLDCTARTIKANCYEVA